jgi:N-glycosylase/DNA lyase
VCVSYKQDFMETEWWDLLNMKLKDNAPEDIKTEYEKWLKSIELT